MNKNPRVIIVGAGVAGIAAACRLIENGFDNFNVLEADNRIGGRIKTQDIDGGFVDLGAQWCHGEGKNAVYNLVKDLDLLKVSYNTYRDNVFVDSTGEFLDKTLTDRLFNIFVEIIYDHDTMKTYEASVGEYFMHRYYQRVIKEFGDNNRNVIIALRMINWMHNFELCHDAPSSWYKSSCSGLTDYWDCDGESMLYWKNGYRTIFDVLLKKIPESSCKLQVEDKVLLNKQVVNINWDLKNSSGATVACLDGSLHKADHVIVTVSLGVLKERYKSLFSPKLPKNKINAIKGLDIGTTNKILLKFPTKWWPNDFKGISFVWTEEDLENLHNEYPHGPFKNGKSWLADVFGFYPIDSHPRVLLAWVVGPMGPEVEQISDTVAVDGLMFLLNKFVGKKFSISKPEEVLRSKWFSNPFTRGSYTYRSLESEKRNVTGDNLASPLISSRGSPTVLFAGEATHLHYYSTVHGALESGYREADRLVNIYKMDLHHKKYEVAIIGAGLAGLGAAKTLNENGVTDFIIIEALNYVGGRVQTIPYDTSFIELGAQWLHDTNNDLYKISKMNNLLSEDTSSEGLGIFIRNDGKIFDKSIVDEVDFIVGKILSECEKFVGADDYPESVGKFLQEEFVKYLELCNDEVETKLMKLQLFDWHIRFQIIDNACLSLHDLSAKYWGKYSTVNCEGQKHINFKNGYTSLINVLVNDLPADCILFNAPVMKIQRTEKFNEEFVIITLQNKSEICTRAVIVTCSLGVLKHGRCVIDPPLSDNISRSIACMGYFGIGKIFLHFKEKWWKHEGYQLLWQDDTKLSTDENWTRYITGFDSVANHPNMLLCWVGGRGLLKMERLKEEVIGLHCVSLLRKFTNNFNIPYPIRVIRSASNCNKWLGGAYCHATPMSDVCELDYSTLSEPQWIGKNGIPRLVLAGEACHSSFFSTTHGAFHSGQQQAKFFL